MLNEDTTTLPRPILGPGVHDILAAVASGVERPRDLVESLQRDVGYIRLNLHRLTERGFLEPYRRGQYRATEIGRAYLEVFE